MPAPQPLVDLLNSLQLVGIPNSAAPGDQINPRVIPDLAPLPGGLPSAALGALTQTVTLAQIDADLAPILAYIAATLGLDSDAVQKAVEFAKPVDAHAGDIDVSSGNVGDLPHLIPNAASLLSISQNVEGLIGRALSKFTFQPGELVSTVTAIISKPAVIADPSVTLTFRVVDGAGNPLVDGVDFFISFDPFAPTVVLMPVIADPDGISPQSVR